MDGGLAHTKPLCRRAHRRLVLYDVKRQPAGALLYIPFQTATLPEIVWACFPLPDLYAQRARDMWGAVLRNHNFF